MFEKSTKELHIVTVRGMCVGIGLNSQCGESKLEYDLMWSSERNSVLGKSVVFYEGYTYSDFFKNANGRAKVAPE